MWRNPTPEKNFHNFCWHRENTSRAVISVQIFSWASLNFLVFKSCQIYARFTRSEIYVYGVTQVKRWFIFWILVFATRTVLILEWSTTFNPLSPNGDQHQFSPNNIHMLPRDKDVRINNMITKEKMPWSFIKFSQVILRGNVWRSVWRICMWILGLKGLMFTSMTEGTSLHFAPRCPVKRVM